MNKTSIGSRILQRRKVLGLSQRALGKAAQVTYATISLWEGDKTEPKGKNVYALAKALQCSPAWILFGDQDQLPPPPVEASEENGLSTRHRELIDLFDSLPESEQEAQIIELRARVENNNRLFDELLLARKRQKNLSK